MRVRLGSLGWRTPEGPTEAGDITIVSPVITATLNVLVVTFLRIFSINILCDIHPDFSKTGLSVAGVLALKIRDCRVAATADKILSRLGIFACRYRILLTIH